MPRTTTMRGTASEVVQRPPGANKSKGLTLALIGAGAVIAVAVVAVVAGGGGGGTPAEPSGVVGTTPPAAPEPTAPVAEAPKPEPAAEAPKPAEPVAEAPKPAEPVAEAPKPAEPVAEPAAPPPPAKVHVSLTSEPSGAKVILAGKVVGTTPYELDLDPAEGKLAYGLTLEGHELARVDLPADKGGSQTVKLERTPAPPPPKPEAPVAAATTPPKPAPAATPAPASVKKKKTKPVKDGTVNPFR
jgi:hypothetical protein